MPSPRFIQIHSLVSYPAVLLNRDDAGLAKRVSYGGSVRTRVSSQCLKRHWRTAEDDWSLAMISVLSEKDFAARSRHHFSRAIGLVLKAENFDEEKIHDVLALLLTRVFGGGADESDDDAQKGKKKKGNSLADLQTKQAFILTSSEIYYLTDLARQILKGDEQLRSLLNEKPKKGSLTDLQKKIRSELSGNLQALEQGAVVPKSLEGALFGRMVTSDLLANTDAAIHVAHAFTVHAQESETDYFTVVDDLKNRDPDEDSGSAGIFDTELTSGLFYEYVVIDVPLLVSNITGVRPEGWAGSDVDRALPAKVAEHLLHLIATISPGAKKGSTAPYARASTLLVEAGSAQPRSLAKAFEKPVQARPGQSQGTLAELALFDALKRFDGIYGKTEARAYASFDGAAFPALADGPQSLDALGGWLNGVISRAEA